MTKSLLMAAIAMLSLSACSIYVDGEKIEAHRTEHSSLTVRSDSDRKTTVSCMGGTEPYSEGGENGEPLVMGCRKPYRD